MTQAPSVLVQSIQLEQLSKMCGDFFKKLSDYCYEYPKLNPISSKVQNTTNNEIKEEKSKKRPKQKYVKYPKKTVDPNLPKKPLTAYIAYFQQHKPRFQQIYPDLNLSDITKLIAKEWKQRPDKFKKPYLQKAQNDRKRYENQLGQYESNRRPKENKAQQQQQDIEAPNKKSSNELEDPQDQSEQNANQ